MTYLKGIHISSMCVCSNTKEECIQEDAIPEKTENMVEALRGGKNGQKGLWLTLADTRGGCVHGQRSCACTFAQWSQTIEQSWGKDAVKCTKTVVLSRNTVNGRGGGVKGQFFWHTVKSFHHSLRRFNSIYFTDFNICVNLRGKKSYLELKLI